MSISRERLALFAAALTGIQVGGAIVATRSIVHDIGPFSLGMLRYAMAVLVLLPFLWAYRRVRIRGRDLIGLGILGAVQFGVLIALANISLQTISAGRGALLFATFPLMTMILAAAVGRERITLPKTVGVLLTIAGVGAVLGERLPFAPSGTTWTGDLAMLGAALSGAVCSILTRPYLARYPTLPVGALAMFASVVALFPPSLGEGVGATLAVLPLPVWLVIAGIGLSSGIGYTAWLYALKHASPTRVTVFLGLSPVTAALFGTLVLGEPLTPGMGIGMVCVLGGLWLAVSFNRPAVVAADPASPG